MKKIFAQTHMSSDILVDHLPIELLFNQYKSKLLNYFLKLTNGNSFDSEDLVQTVFLKLLINGGKYSGSGRFEAWLFTIARNCARDYYRKKRVEDWLEENPMINNLSIDSQQNEHQDQKDLLYAALSIIDPRSREIIYFSTFQGLSHREIAKVLGISESASRTRNHRAITKLKKIFHELAKKELKDSQ